MKFENKKKINRSSKRNLETFSSTLFQLIEQKSFETISVNEICDISDYPRATFYNYFHDKYDLLEYCWSILEKEMKLDLYREVSSEELLYMVFNSMYDYFSLHSEELSHILYVNFLDGVLVTTFGAYMKQKILMIMTNSDCPNISILPYQMIAEHYCNTLLLVLEWSFVRSDKLTRMQANESLTYLLNDI